MRRIVRNLLKARYTNAEEAERVVALNSETKIRFVVSEELRTGGIEC